jgi:hypothetical protein
MLPEIPQMRHPALRNVGWEINQPIETKPEG